MHVQPTDADVVKFLRGALAKRACPVVELEGPLTRPASEFHVTWSPTLKRCLIMVLLAGSKARPVSAFLTLRRCARLAVEAIRNASSRGNIPYTTPLRIVQGDHETGPQATPRWAASRVADLSMPAMRSCRHAPGRGRTLILVGPTQESEDQQIAATKKLSTADLRAWIGKVGWESKWRPRSYGRSTSAVPPTLDPVQDRYNQAR